MKKLFIRSNLMIATILLLVTACEQDNIMFDSSMNLVGFSATSLVVPENIGGSASVYLGAVPGTAETTTLTLETDTVGLGNNAAVDGVDYNLSAKSISVSPNSEATLDITPVNNAVFTGDKSFYIVITTNSKNYKLSAQSRILVTISDDEHPLKNWIGTYDVHAASFTEPGAWDEAWVVTTSPVEGHPDQLLLEGIGLSGAGLIATFDVEAMTITIKPGQDIGLAYADWGYNVAGEDEITVYFGYEDLTWESDVDLVGTIETNGDMTINGWCHIQEDGDIWDVFNTTWTKQ